MADKVWTPEQTAAMTVRNKNLLISAAAGSGKTATLTERIIRRLTDEKEPADISRMLIVTFTRAAASELRTRIFGAVSEALVKNPHNKHLSSQLVKIGSARICTIDAFYLDEVRKNVSALGMPIGFRLGDPSEMDLLAKDVMEDVIGEYYDKDADGFARFAECFTQLRNLHTLSDVLLDLYSHVSSYESGVEFLRLCEEKTRRDADKDFFDTDFGAVLRQDCVQTLEHAVTIYEQALPFFVQNEEHTGSYRKTFESELGFLKALYETAKSRSYADTRGMFSCRPMLRPTGRGMMQSEEFDQYKQQRKEVNASLTALAERMLSLPAEDVARAMTLTADYTHILYTLLSEFDARCDQEKHERKLYSFNDVRRAALRLFVNGDGTPTPLAKETASCYDEIYIDEYQDVDRVQDSIFSAISNGRNRFMVGDIKQCIYCFRGAQPDVFSGYRRAFPMHGSKEAEASEDETVFMSQNFRCDESVIDFTNAVCSYLFSFCQDSIGYSSFDDLGFAKGKPNEEYRSAAVELTVITKDTEDAEEDSEEEEEHASVWEARQVALTIRHLLAHEKKADGTPFRPGDIAILYRSHSKAAILTPILEEYGIPYAGGKGNTYFENAEVALVLCVLNAIDNPHRDIYLSGMLRSPLFGFTMDDLVILRRAGEPAFSVYDCVEAYAKADNALGGKCQTVCDVLSAWRDASLSISVDKLLRYLFTTEQFRRTSLPSSPHVLRLYDYARRFEAGSYRGLFQFIEYLRRVIDAGVALESDTAELRDDCVNLLTIHHSKGLEFPAVFLFASHAAFEKRSRADSLLFHHDLGVAMKLSEPTGFGRVNTPLREAILATKATEETEEQIRVLYVALTRARERLFITGYGRTTAERILSRAEKTASFGDRYSLLHTDSYLQWILTALSAYGDPSAFCKLCFLTPADIRKALSSMPPLPDAARKEEDGEKTDTELLHRSLAYSYPYFPLSSIPSKLSVSRLSPDTLDSEADAVALFEEEPTEQIPAFFSGKEQAGKIAAERGTLTHLFLQFCDFDRLSRLGVASELDRLLSKRFLPSHTREMILTEELEAFARSSLLREILSAQQVFREQRFHILMPVGSFTQNEKLGELVRNEQIAVQGVIDLVMLDRNDELVLVDYKTDRLSAEECRDDRLLHEKMQQKHARQLSYYAVAAEKLFLRPCTRLLVYATAAGRCTELSRLPL